MLHGSFPMMPKSRMMQELKVGNILKRTERTAAMGIPTNIKTLLSGNVVEWARIEFKETWDAEASLKTICAFANDIDNWGGGYLVIGVEDKDGKPTNLIGVAPEKIDSYLKDMLNKCKKIQPEYMPITEVVDYENKKFIVVWYLLAVSVRIPQRNGKGRQGAYLLD